MKKTLLDLTKRDVGFLISLLLASICKHTYNDNDLSFDLSYSDLKSFWKLKVINESKIRL